MARNWFGSVDIVIFFFRHNECVRENANGLGTWIIEWLLMVRVH